MTHGSKPYPQEPSDSYLREAMFYIEGYQEPVNGYKTEKLPLFTGFRKWYRA